PTPTLSPYTTLFRSPDAPAECRWTQEFTISDIYLTKARNADNSAVLTDADGTEWETTYSSRGPVLNQLDEGDRVTATLWRGRVIDRKSTRLNSSHVK